MKHLSSYKEIKKICDEYNIKNWSINKDGLVNVDDDVNLEFKDLGKLPLNFGRVEGRFFCNGNRLSSLEGAPKEVGNRFHCYGNELTNLEGAPEEVDGSFQCYENNLTSLEGAPKKIDGDFYCYNNNLTSLEGSPKEISGDFYCDKNRLTTLEGAPREVGGGFDCDKNKLTTLKGAPKEVGGNFSCKGNNLINLEGVPYDIKNLNCLFNPIYEVWGLINKVEYLQEFVEVYDVVRPGKVVILEYLNDIRKLMGKEPVEREEIPDDWGILDI